MPAFVVVLSVIVFVHEMGHYLVARWNGIAIQTFSLGFGPELVGFNDRHGTRWKLSAIPLGGYVRFVGDMNAASVPDPEAVALLPPEEQQRLFINKNVWQRIAVVVAGPVANILLTFVILYALLIGYGRYTQPPVLGDMKWGSIALEAGLLPGDRITEVDGFAVRGFEDFDRLVSTAPGRKVTIGFERDGRRSSVDLVPAAIAGKDRFGNDFRLGDIGLAPPPTLVADLSWSGVAIHAGLLPGDVLRAVDSIAVTSADDFATAISKSPGKPVTIRVERGGRDLTLTVVPRAVQVQDSTGKTLTIGRIGVVLKYADPEQTLYRPGPLETAGMALDEMRFIVVRTAEAIGDLFTERRDFRNLGGPIEVAKASGEIASLGPTALVFFIATVSLSIGIFNLLPIPMLDGGHLVFYLAEAVRGRPLSMRFQEIGFRIGLAVIASLFILVLVTNTIPHTLPNLVSRLLGASPS